MNNPSNQQMKLMELGQKYPALEAENNQLRKTVRELIEFIDSEREAQRPDVWWMLVRRLKQALQQENSDAKTD